MKGPEDIRTSVAKLAEQRNWEKFHCSKNLMIALSVEVAELMETFQWLTEEQSANLSAEKTQTIMHEIADVQVYLVRLADRVGINILEAVY